MSKPLPTAPPPVDSSEDALREDVALALAGRRDALERVVRSVQPLVSRLALRFFGCPQHAADATQEVLVQLVTKLDRFAGESAFTTWVYRVATNKFLSMARSPAERGVLSIEAFERDLAELPSEPAEPIADVEHALLLEEVKIGCTLAMLLCLDRDARMAYILGAIGELDHETAADIVGASPATYRKRLERARDAITSLMQARCGLFDPANPCRCSRRIPIAKERGYLNPASLLFASSAEQARRYPEVLHQIRKLGAFERAAALYRSHPDPELRTDLARQLTALLESSTD